MKRICLVLSFYILSLMPAAGEEPHITQEPLHIDFYGILSSAIDKNMADMTKNLFYTQLQELDNITVTDKSSSGTFDPASIGTSGTSGIAFFAEITGEGTANGTWTCTLNAQNLENGKKVSVVKEYTSYYKILTEAKASIQDLLAKLKPETSPAQSAAQPRVSTESLAGTWHGENFIDKIVILRGGRGFIIYKNGAAMNINITISGGDGKEITAVIVQSGKPNASFFPELPRKTALENAPAASPIEWKLTLKDSNTLAGSKKTLIEDTDSPTGAHEGESEVQWTRN